MAKKTEKIDFRRISKIDPIDNYMEIIFIVKSINKLLTQINNFYMSQKNSLRKLIKYKKQLQTAQNIAKMASWEYDPEKKEFISLFKNYLGYKEVEDILKKFEDSNIIIEKIKNLCNKDKIIIIEEIKKLDDKYIKIYAKCITQGNKKIVIGVLMDVSNEIKKQERIHYLAYHDTLTGIANRTFLKEELKCLVNFSNRHKSKFAILYLDLDNFKMINDTFGHEIGDKVLIEITNRLKNILRGSDIFARIGGDEFVIVANEIKNNNDVRIISEKILKCLKEPLKINNKKFNVSFSIGISIYPDDSRNIETLFKYADIAMYKAKKEGKNRFEFINEELKKEIKQFYEIATEIKDGIEKNEFQLYFQPQIDIENKKIYGAEALIRWIHPKKGILSPNVFIPIAENNTLIYLIDDYVLKKAFEILNNWKQDKYLRNVKLSINISANSFKRNDFVEQLKKYLEEYKIKPENLEIEITETLSMQDVFYTINTLKELKKIGFSISIDDFGTGYSSLNYLKMLPFDVIKIDRSFIKDITTDKDDYVITKMIVELSKILNKKLIAEGVETKDVLTAIENLGCRYVQGYYFSKPLSEKEFYKYVKNFYA
ncbi:putative bifunctional diguanylate cyclase/phosphodiesterase [Caminibacter sp.]